MSGSLVVSSTLADALTALAAGARPVAGGTDLVVGARQGKKPLPDSIVAIHRLTELRTLTSANGGVRLGSLLLMARLLLMQTFASGTRHLLMRRQLSAPMPPARRERLGAMS
jgi:CO/xanthine dehydrogenase FAD-binding subunit